MGGSLNYRSAVRRTIKTSRALQCWQCHVHDCSINERNARTQDGRGQNPWSVHSGRLGASITANRGFVAGRPRDGSHSSIFRRIAQRWVPEGCGPEALANIGFHWPLPSSHALRVLHPFGSGRRQPFEVFVSGQNYSGPDRWIDPFGGVWARRR